MFWFSFLIDNGTEYMIRSEYNTSKNMIEVSNLSKTYSWTHNTISMEKPLNFPQNIAIIFFYIDLKRHFRSLFTSSRVNDIWFVIMVHWFKLCKSNRSPLCGITANSLFYLPIVYYKHNFYNFSSELTAFITYNGGSQLNSSVCYNIVMLPWTLWEYF